MTPIDEAVEKYVKAFRESIEKTDRDGELIDEFAGDTEEMKTELHDLIEAAEESRETGYDGLGMPSVDPDIGEPAEPPFHPMCRLTETAETIRELSELAHIDEDAVEDDLGDDEYIDADWEDEPTGAAMKVESVDLEKKPELYDQLMDKIKKRIDIACDTGRYTGTLVLGVQQARILYPFIADTAELGGRERIDLEKLFGDVDTVIVVPSPMIHPALESREMVWRHEKDIPYYE